MAGRLINGVRYICLFNNNDNTLKSKSLEDNVYFTLRDIFRNGDYGDIMKANHFNSLLTNNIPFENREEKFKYTNCLHKYDYIKSLLQWLKQISLISESGNYFDFEVNEDEELNNLTFIKIEDWLEKLKELILLLEKRLKRIDKL